MHWLLIYAISLLVLGPVGTLALTAWFALVWLAVHAPWLAVLLGIIMLVLYANRR
jgi:hypothetical protein